MPEQANIQRWIGLDIHKAYFVAVGVNAEKDVVLGPHKILNEQLETWMEKHLQVTDAVVMEMTTNTYIFHDTLVGHVGSVIAVHPPNVLLVTGVRVKTDKKAAQTLAQLHAVGMLSGVWIPPVEVRELRAVIAQRAKMVRLATQAKNRLNAMLHKTHRKRPLQAFKPEGRAWWVSLPLTTLETLAFAEKQVKDIEEVLSQEAAKDKRVPLLTQLPGVAMLTALTILAAIGPIERFKDAKHLT
jgi:transposase